MRSSVYAVVAAAAVMVAAIGTMPAQAAGLHVNLSGNNGGATGNGNGNIVDLGSVGSVDQGPAGNDSLVNVGIGGSSASPNNILDAKIGGNGNGGDGGGLLGGNLLGGGSGNIVDAGNLARIDNGTAADNALVNLGLGGDEDNPNNLADINLGGSNGANGNVNLSTDLLGNGDGDLGGLLGGVGDGGGLLGGDTSLTAGLDLDGLGLGDGGLDVGIGIGSNGDGGGGDGGGILPPPTGDGGGVLPPPDGGGLPGGGGVGQLPGGGQLPGMGGNGTQIASAGGAVNAQCDIPKGRQILQIAASGTVTRATIAAWMQASTVKIVPVQLCPPTRAQVARLLNSSGKINAMQNAAASDALIAASLSRAHHGADDIFAVRKNGASLMVYVL